MSKFKNRLDNAARTNRSLVCVGLDIDAALMPIADLRAFNRAIVDATKDLVCAYKPNIAFYEALGLEGLARCGTRPRTFARPLRMPFCWQTPSAAT